MSKSFEKTFYSLAVFLLLWKAVVEFYFVADGTGNWYMNFSQKWLLALIGFTLFCIFLFILFLMAIWGNQLLNNYWKILMDRRQNSSWLRWAGMFLSICLPLFFLRFSIWSVVFNGIYIRSLVLMLFSLALAFFITFSETKGFEWKSLIEALIIFSFVVVSFAQFMDVASFPFSNGWSEGNRLWDYSILFGRGRYDYPSNLPLVPYLDFGRQLIGGFDFLYPHLTIIDARFWVDFVNVIPYILLGSALFLSKRVDEENLRSIAISLLVVVWVYLFLSQGPIHPPLVFVAIFVVFAWKQKYWIFVPLLIIGSYFAAISRFTWSFAVPIWIVMLEFASAKTLNTLVWFRSSIGAIASLLGAIGFPKLIGYLQGTNLGIYNSNLGEASSQPLLWYRLLPNATYPQGVLIGSLIATAPVFVLLIYLITSGVWKIKPLQIICLLLPLTAFYIVGLIISTKAGGGGDLHNLDMFLIGLLFSFAIAWFNGAREWFERIEVTPIYIRMLILFIFIYPAMTHIQWFRPSHYQGDTTSLLTLTGNTNPRALGFLPSDQLVNEGLDAVRNAVTNANGEVLFMDQRQLLTFHYVSTKLIPDYDKKLLIDKAMTGDQIYFTAFYKDITAHRFSLIISDPLKVPNQTSEDQFGEENNIWVRWVARPVLCYYEPTETYPELRLQLLVPREGVQDCSSELPFELSQ